MPVRTWFGNRDTGNWVVIKMNHAQRKSFALIVFFLLMLTGALAAVLRSVSRAPSRPPLNEARTGRLAKGNQQNPTASPEQPVAPQAINAIDPHIIAGGGGTSTNGSLRLDGTIGQIGGGAASSGGQFSVSAGFWPQVSGAPATATPTPPANVIQFSSSSYNVGEACTTVTITVNRIGDTSGAASVNYFTADVTATERRDYITAIGTLGFAAGETSKSFVVLINDDSYVEGNETFNISLSNPSGATLGAPTVATVTIIDNPTEPATNVIDDPRIYVCQHYHDFLNRQPDQSGWDFWTNEITSCGADQQCIDLKRLNVSAAFYLSIEFQQTGYLVERIYKAAYGDINGGSSFNGAHQLPVPTVRFNEFMPDTQGIGQGVIVGQTGWEIVLENNKQSYAARFVQSSRFTTAFPTSMSPAQFVDKLNQNAGGVLSAGERTTLIALFGSAVDTTNSTARGQALRQVAEDPDLNSAEFNRAFVLMQYIGYLRRNPNDPPDTDYTGYDFWLSKLNQFNGNFVNAEMVKAFISSIEYRQRFGL